MENEEPEVAFFLYDQDKEIGLLNEQGDILQLKVLGLGIAGDIGAAVAVELNQVVYAPLHDFSGNCIALINAVGDLAETYQIYAFGKEVTTPSSPQNPWRFSSKRQEEALVFFGLRFYDIDLERWLTPDPSRFADGPNLYAYAFNSPLNRLDLFGLSSFEMRQPRPMIEASVAHIRNAMNSKESMIHAHGVIDGIRMDWYVSCGHWHKMQFTAEELNTGKVNLLDHFAELTPTKGNSVGALTLQNGIKTTFMEFKEMGQSVVDKVPEGTLFFGMYNPTKGLILDVLRTFSERWGCSTSIVRSTSQMMGAIADTIHKINPEMIWVDSRHSEGGVVGRRSIEMLTDDQKQILKKQFYCIPLGPAQMIPREYGLEVYNLYSDKDGITKRYAKEQKDGFTYTVKFLECISPCRERTLFFADHCFMSPTYQKGLRDEFEDIREKRGFYDGNTR